MEYSETIGPLGDLEEKFSREQNAYKQGLESFVSALTNPDNPDANEILEAMARIQSGEGTEDDAIRVTEFINAQLKASGMGFEGDAVSDNLGEELLKRVSDE